MINLSKVQSGYNTEHILIDDRHRSAGRLVATSTRARWSASSALPGVQHAAFAWGVPLTGNNWPGAIEIEGQPPAAKPTDRVAVPLRVGHARIFRAARLDRSWTAATSARPTSARRRGSRSSTGARRPVLPGRHRDRQEDLAWRRASSRAMEIVGVVANGRTDDLTRAAEPEIYMSLWQAARSPRTWWSGRRPIRGRSRRPSSASCARSIRPWRSKT